MGIKKSSKPNMKWANSQKPMVSRSRLDWILTLLQPCVLLLLSSTPLKRDAKKKKKFLFLPSLFFAITIGKTCPFQHASRANPLVGIIKQVKPFYKKQSPIGCFGPPNVISKKEIIFITWAQIPHHMGPTPSGSSEPLDLQLLGHITNKSS